MVGRMNSEHKYYPATTLTKLGYLTEECGEVLAAVGKAIRWGLDSSNPELEDGEINREWILRELLDLEQAIELVRKDITKLESNLGER